MNFKSVLLILWGYPKKGIQIVMVGLFLIGCWYCVKLVSLLEYCCKTLHTKKIASPNKIRKKPHSNTFDIFRYFEDIFAIFLVWHLEIWLCTIFILANWWIILLTLISKVDSTHFSSTCCETILNFSWFLIYPFTQLLCAWL